MPNLSILDFEKSKNTIPFDLLKTGPVLNVKEGDSIIATYTSAADKMRIFSAFIREGLENGDAVEYVYPDEESETVRTKLKDYGINVEEYEKGGALQMKSTTDYFMTGGKFDPEKGFTNTIKFWHAAKKKGYNHARNIEDVGNFSFINGQWQKHITEYWLNPRFSYSSKRPWKESKKSKERVRVVAGFLYSSFMIDITAINIENMSETQIHDMLKTFDRGKHPPTRLINLLEHADTFSKRIGISHQELLGRRILFEFDPTSDYENVVDDFVREAMANAEATPTFTYAASTIHKCLARHPTIKFFKMSTSTSNIQPESESEILIPAGNIDLIQDLIAKVAKTYSETNVSIVFDGLTDLLTSLEPERTLTFLHNALQTLSSKRITALLLLNSTAHDQKTLSRLRSMFYTQIAYGKEGLQIIKLPKVE
jgi:hypothetical protein